MYKAVKNVQEQKGLTLIELLSLVAIFLILAAFAIPGYLGMCERGRKPAVIRTAEANLPDLQRWMISAKKAGTLQGSLTEIDTDGDGAVVPGTDITNDAIGAAGFDFLTNAFLPIYHPTAGPQPMSSPWLGGATTLFTVVNGQTSMAGCEGAAGIGQITLCPDPAADKTIEAIYVVAKDNDTSAKTGNGNTIYFETVTVTTDFKNRNLNCLKTCVPLSGKLL